MTFWNPSLWLWLLAGLASVFMLQSAYSALSWLWRLPERMPKITGSSLLKPGEQERFLEPPKKLTAKQVGTMMLVLAGVLGAYQVGATTKYSREYAAWQQRSAEYQKAYAAWAARQPKKEIR